MADGGDELVRYVVGAQGLDATAAGFRKVADAQQATQRSADELSQHLRATTRTAEVEARALARTAQEAATASAATARQTAAAIGSSVSAASGNMTQIAQRASIMLGSLTSAASGIIPGIEGAGGAIARMSGAMGAASTILTGAGEGATAGSAGGPVGAIVVGGLIGAVGLLSLALKDNKKSAEEAKDEIAELAKGWAEADDAAREAYNHSEAGKDAAERKARRDEHDRVKGLQMGFANPASPASPVFQNAGQWGTDDKGVPFTSEAAALGYARQKESEQGAKDKAKREAAARAAAGKPRPFSDTTEGRAELGRNEGIPARAQAEQDALTNARKTAESMAGGQGAYDKSMAASNAEFAAADLERERARSTEESITEIQQREYEKREAAAEAHYGAIRDMGKRAFDTIAGAASNMVGALVSGQKFTLKAFLQMLGGQVAAQGTADLLHALFLVATGDVVAAGAVPFAAAEVAFGATLGGAASSSGGGGSGGGRRPGTPYNTGAPPTLAPSRSTGAQNQQPYVVNNFPSIIAPTAREGQLVDQADAERRRQGR